MVKTKCGKTKHCLSLTVVSVVGVTKRKEGKDGAHLFEHRIISSCSFPLLIFNACQCSQCVKTHCLLCAAVSLMQGVDKGSEGSRRRQGDWQQSPTSGGLGLEVVCERDQ